MHEFIAKHQDKIVGTLSGFDRLVFRGDWNNHGNGAAVGCVPSVP